jgi:hypothetical protein
MIERSTGKIFFMEALRAGTNIYPFQDSNELVDTEIINLLKYFSLFRHPLKLSEILKLLPDNIKELDAKFALRKMDISGTIKKIDAYYLLATDDDTIIEKRITGEIKATHLFPKAKRTAHFISLFPFVKFVGISGSLSKNYADEKTDFDFFIITANNTLWICRTILHLVKKLSFIIGKQHHLCMNYFIDEHHLKLDEKNLFTRIELSTLIPVYNKNIYKTFLLRNQDNLSNIQHLDVDFEGAVKFNLITLGKKNLLWKSLNLFLMHLTDRKWKHKWEKKGFPMDDYQLAFKTTPYVSKNHPANYQKKVLEQLQKR